MNNVLKCSNCVGCAACAAICPKKCIDIKENKFGFFSAVIDSSLCVSCGACTKVCQQIKQPATGWGYKGVYSVQAIDRTILANSTSGGISTIISEAMIKKGWNVYAAEYDYEHNTCEHIIINEISDLERVQGSKYIQSFMDLTCLKKDKKYVVFGTPCQIAGIHEVINAKQYNRNNYLLVELFCFGTPSYHLYKSYLKDRFGKNTKFKKVEFRSKKYGWHHYTFKFIDENDNCFYFDQDIDRDSFFYLFKRRACLNNNCYNCQYRQGSGMADLRIGDYWGDKYKDDKLGVNIVIAYSDMGESAIKLIEPNAKVQKEDYEIATKVQLSKATKKPLLWYAYIILLRNEKLKVAKSMCVLSQKIERIIKRG